MKLHPWNVGFEWRDCGVEAFDRDGFIIVPDLLDADLLRAVRDEIDGFEAEADATLQRAEQGRILIAETGAITFTTHLVERSPRLRALTEHPRLRAICADLLAPDADFYWDQAVYKKPEKPRRFPWHQDNGYGFLQPQHYLTFWIALTDATLANGCPWVAPGRHRLGTLAHTYVDPLGFECFDEVPDAVAAEVPAGGAVVFSSLTPHLTGPNTTDEVRKAYIVQYAPRGAEVLQGDPAAGPPTARVPAVGWRS